jgi:hypothetical protein
MDLPCSPQTKVLRTVNSGQGMKRVVPQKLRCNFLAEVASLKLSSVPPSSPYVTLLVGKTKQGALVDSGATRSLVSSTFYEKLERSGDVISSRPCDIKCWTASLSPLAIRCIATLKLKIDGFSS